MHEHVEDLRLDRGALAGVAQLVPVEVELGTRRRRGSAPPLQDVRQRPSVANRGPATCLVRKEAGVVTPGVMSPAWFGGVGARGWTMLLDLVTPGGRVVSPAPPGRPTTGRTPPNRSCSPRSTSATAAARPRCPAGRRHRRGAAGPPAPRRRPPARRGGRGRRVSRLLLAGGSVVRARPPRTGRRPRRRRCRRRRRSAARPPRTPRRRSTSRASSWRPASSTSRSTARSASTWPTSPSGCGRSGPPSAATASPASSRRSSPPRRARPSERWPRWPTRPTGFVGAEPLGLHLEGPMLNPERRGAHDPALLRPPSPALVEGLDPGRRRRPRHPRPRAAGRPRRRGAASWRPAWSSPPATPRPPPTSSIAPSRRGSATSRTCSTPWSPSATAIRDRSAWRWRTAGSPWGSSRTGSTSTRSRWRRPGARSARRASASSPTRWLRSVVLRAGSPSAAGTVTLGDDGVRLDDGTLAGQRARPRRGGAEPHRLHRVLAGRVHRDRHRDARPGPRPPAQGNGGARLRRRSHPAHRRSPGRHHLRRAAARSARQPRVAAWRS